MEKGLKAVSHKKKFRSPAGARKLHRMSFLPRVKVNLQVRGKHGNRKMGSKLQFRMGGDSTDPLNLNSLIDRDPSEITPQCSPYIDRLKESSPRVVIAKDITDPLNLKCDLYQDLKGIVEVSPAKKRRKRKRNDNSLDEEEQENMGRSNGGKDNFSFPKCRKKKMHKGKDGKEVKKEKNMEKVNGKIVDKDMNKGSKKHASDASTEEIELKIADDAMDGPEKNMEDIQGVKKETVVGESANDELVFACNTHELEALAQAKSIHRKEKSKKTFLYGNYNRYYGYRNPQLPDDSRLRLFRREWFEDKMVLDIGCNIGNVTIQVARDFRPKHVLGVDIDSSLIRTANKHLRCAIQEHTSQKARISSDFPMSFMLCRGPIVMRTSPQDGQTGFPYNVQFKEENFVLQNPSLLAKQKPRYDVILCLSLTKWIHLNWGDDGLKTAFQRMFLLLRPGGRLLLEAQPFDSYLRRKNLSEKIRRNYDSIQFKPNQFVDYLMSEEVGFASYEALGVAENKSKGFQRPVYVFTKSVTNESYDALGVNIAENRNFSWQKQEEY